MRFKKSRSRAGARSVALFIGMKWPWVCIDIVYEQIRSCSAQWQFAKPTQGPGGPAASHGAGGQYLRAPAAMGRVVVVVVCVCEGGWVEGAGQSMPRA